MANDYPPAHRAARGHPIHTLLAAFPLAFFTGAFVTDIFYANTANFMWANFSTWLITGGLIMGGLAAIAGVVDALMGRRTAGPRGAGAWPHTLGTLLVLVLALFNAFIHSRDGWNAVVPTGITLSGIVCVLVIVTSWLGTSLAQRQRAGVV